jgi:3-methyladenine DNA glycosylase/8-oxoguanine DNA glycosylase
VIAALVRVRGIGPWSAHMHLILSLARPDVWPTGDYGVRKGLQRWLGLAEVPTPREAEALGEPFRPWRTVLAWSMWRIHELERWEV